MTGKRPLNKHVCECGKQFFHTFKHKKYCSNKCAHKYKPSRTYSDITRNSQYLKNYGITLDTYNFMFLEQEGCCMICKIHQSQCKQNLHVDHDHETGQVRGLLCQKCNHALGLFKDNPQIIQAALEYVS